MEMETAQVPPDMTVVCRVQIVIAAADHTD